MDIHTTSQVSHHNMLNPHYELHKCREHSLITVKASLLASPLSQKRISLFRAMLTLDDILFSPALELVRGPRAPGERNKKSPTKSTGRARWTSLLPWNTFASEVSQYINCLPAEERTQFVASDAYLDDKIQDVRDKRLPIHEDDLHTFFEILYVAAHGRCASAPNATHYHAKIERPNLQETDIQPDFVFLHDNKTVGIIECKCFWNVTPQSIDEVINGISLAFRYTDPQGTAPLEGEHHGRLAMEQTYGYMVRSRRKHGILTTLNGWAFMYRLNGGMLFTTRLIPWNVAYPQPTIRQALYYLSAVVVTAPIEVEKNPLGVDPVIAPASGRYALPAPVVPGPPVCEPTKGGVAAWNQSFSGGYKFTLQPALDFPNLLFQPWIPSNRLGNKTFLATFMPEGRVVVGKFWDGWHHTTEDRDHEVDMYMRLQSLWGSVVPRFIGCAEYEWHITLFVEKLEVFPSCNLVV